MHFYTHSDVQNTLHGSRRAVSVARTHSIFIPSTMCVCLSVGCVLVLSFSCFSPSFTSSLPHPTCTLTSTSSPMSTASRDLTIAPSHNEEYCSMAKYHPLTLRPLFTFLWCTYLRVHRQCAGHVVQMIAEHAGGFARARCTWDCQAIVEHVVQVIVGPNGKVIVEHVAQVISLASFARNGRGTLYIKKRPFLNLPLGSVRQIGDASNDKACTRENISEVRVAVEISVRFVFSVLKVYIDCDEGNCQRGANWSGSADGAHTHCSWWGHVFTAVEWRSRVFDQFDCDCWICFSRV